MGLPTHALVPGLSGDRFAATYRIEGDRPTARARAADIAVEQTVEFPPDLLPAGDIPGSIVGRVEAVVPDGELRWRATISFAIEVAGDDLVQLLNVAFGNSSLQPGVRLVALDLPDAMLRHFHGPRFGRDGIRRLVGAAGRPLLSSAIKPLGLAVADLAKVAGALASGGIDIVKDDQGLADQPFGRFRDRFAACAGAIAEANARTGGACLYFANVTTRADRMLERAHEAKVLGATGLLVCPGLVGFTAMDSLARDESLGLPVMSHPSFIGSHVAGPRSGIGHGLVFGTLQRLAGADLSVFPSFGGRFSFSIDECREIADACATPLGAVRSILPTPGGGLTAATVSTAADTYGLDAAYLVGGGLHRVGEDLAANVRVFRDLIRPPGSAMN